MIPLKTDCRFFRGDVPCKPHKQFGVHCVDDQGVDCPHYDRTEKKILIIKLGAIGDVIRTTPLLHRLKAVHPTAKLYWLTLTPEVVPSLVDVVMGFTLNNIVTLRSTTFDILYNLDKDREACALAAQIEARVKKGFILKNGLTAPIDAAAQDKFLTGVFDDLSQANKKSYLQEIFEICDFTYERERYILEAPAKGKTWNLNRKKKIIGLNTGCGGRWISRRWDEKNWASLATALKKKGYEVVLLGGEQEHQQNLRLKKKSGAKYFGHFPLETFIDLVNQCNLVVTGVTMAMHITIGLGKKIVLFNNIFNRHEFELYDLGVILEPDRPCRCFYQPVCTNDEYQCMHHLAVPRVVEACEQLCPPSWTKGRRA